jgi:tetratricopeptide (TPR) repeat protein
MIESGERRETWTASLLLFVAVLVVFWPALHCGFVFFDDNVYVTENLNVHRGLTWPSLKWAFTAIDGGSWMPLTWVSHMVDYQLYQLRPPGHHLTSILWHAANAVLLFLFLKRMTGAFWRSAFVAAAFALHPLRVESVAWVAERKDVLSTFFGWGAIWCYVRYTEEFKDQSSWKFFVYGITLLLYLLTLMAKPMLVTLPFLLLLLDYWPLGRVRILSDVRWLLTEKIPFLIIAVVFSATTFIAQYHVGAVKSLVRYSFGQRLGNVPVSYVRYLYKIFWPANLGAFYPPEKWPAWEIAGATLLVAVPSVWVIRQWRARPYLGVGWFWFLGAMVPTVGLVQVGDQSMADRYTYVPGVGILIMVAWGLYDLARARAVLREGLVVGGGLAVLICAILTWRQIPYWKNTVTLFSHALEVTGPNYLADYNLGCAALAIGNYPSAITYLETALHAPGKEIPFGNPAPAHNNLGCALLQEGEVPAAVSQFEKALAIQPNFPEVYYNMGRAFMTNHQPDVAVESFQQGLALDPRVAEMNYSAGEAFLDLGRASDAARYLEKALQSRPAFALAEYQLGNALVQQKRVSDALPHYRRAEELASAQGNPGLAADAQRILRQYEVKGK